MGNKAPRPKEINFPEIQKKDWNFSKKSQKDPKGDKQKFARNIWLLKSGNILISYNELDEVLFRVKNCLVIYSVPDLKVVEDYKFDAEVDETIYQIDFACQSNKGNIFMISDRLKIFDGENISKGPKQKSEEIGDINFYSFTKTFYESSDRYKKHPIEKNAKIFYCDFLIEVKEDIFLYTQARWKDRVFLLDISKSNIEKNEIFHYLKQTKYGPRNYELDIINKSEYQPENLYVIANYEDTFSGGTQRKYESILLCFNLEEFIKQNKTSKEPLFSIQVSNSVRVYAFGEYDEKYILLDTYKNGIYIIDVELKQKVAVCVPRLYYKEENKYFSFYEDKKAENGDFYRKMIKLKDGQVFMNGYILDVREQIIQQKAERMDFLRFVISGEYITCYFNNTLIYVYQFNEEE